MAAVPDPPATLAGTRLCDHRRTRAPGREQHLPAHLAEKPHGLSARKRLALYVADTAILAGIAPGPADAVVEHREGFARLELTNDFRILRGPCQQRRPGFDHPLHRLRVVRSEHPIGERHVGEVVAV